MELRLLRSISGTVSLVRRFGSDPKPCRSFFVDKINHPMAAPPLNNVGCPTKTKLLKKNEDDFICPINLNLPVDPVVAEDGNVYERQAIEDYIKSMEGKEITSPLTRQKMGNKLTPALQTRNAIETLVENGAITGDAAEDWKKRLNAVDHKKNRLLERANAGDMRAMKQVAFNYGQGQNGFGEDRKESYNWYQKASEDGSVIGMSKVGEYLLHGIGVDKDIAQGMMYLGMAEGRGSDFAAGVLGIHLAFGPRYGVPIANKAKARKLLEKALSGDCLCKCMDAQAKQYVQKKLDELNLEFNSLATNLSESCTKSTLDGSG